jgi:hypothetical protein
MSPTACKSFDLFLYDEPRGPSVSADTDFVLVDQVAFYTAKFHYNRGNVGRKEFNLVMRS